MQHIPMLLLTLATMAAAVYAHCRLPFHTGSRQQLWISRTILLVLGVAFGWVNAYASPAPPAWQVVLFLGAFGAVHVPAAFILFIKRQRRVWK